MLEYFDEEMNKIASIQELKTIVDPVTHTSTRQYTEVATKTGFLYTKSQTQSFVSSRWSDLVQVVFICEPPLDVSTESKVVIDGVDYYAEVPDDVGNQGEVLLVGLRTTK